MHDLQKVTKSIATKLCLKFEVVNTTNKEMKVFTDLESIYFKVKNSLHKNMHNMLARSRKQLNFNFTQRHEQCEVFQQSILLIYVLLTMCDLQEIKCKK